MFIYEDNGFFMKYNFLIKAPISNNLPIDMSGTNIFNKNLNKIAPCPKFGHPAQNSEFLNALNTGFVDAVGMIQSLNSYTIDHSQLFEKLFSCAKIKIFI